MPLVDTFTGHCSFRGGSCTISAFFIDPKFKTKEPLYSAARKQRETQVHAINSGSAFVNAHTQIANVGAWQNVRYDLPEGSYILVRAHRREGGRGAVIRGFGGEQEIKMLLRVRDKGPLTRIAFKLIDDDYASQRTGEMWGRFEIAYLDQLYAEFGEEEVNEMLAAIQVDPDEHWDSPDDIDAAILAKAVTITVETKASEPLVKPKVVQTIALEGTAEKPGKTVRLNFGAGRKLMPGKK